MNQINYLISHLVFFLNQPLQVAVFLVSLYILGEVIAAARKAHKGDKFCRTFKYLSTISAAVYGLHLAWFIRADFSHLVMLSATALFLWPTMVYRFRGDYRNRLNDK